MSPSLEKSHEKSVDKFQNAMYNRKQNNSVFRFPKGVASRHPFTYASRIRCTSPQKPSSALRLGRFLQDGLAPLSRNARRTPARLRLAIIRLCVSPCKLVLF